MREKAKLNQPYLNITIDKTRRENIINKIEEILLTIIKSTSFPSRYSLMSGELGPILFLFYYSKTFNSDYYYNFALRRLNEFIEKFSYCYSGYTFCDGLAGVAWAISHISKDFLNNQDDEDILNNEIDETLFKAIQVCPEIKFSDFLHGALGISYYFIQRNTLKSDYYLEYFVNRLLEISKYDKESNGLKWDSIDSTFSNRILHNLGMAHGSAGILEVLRLIWLKKINIQTTERLINGTLNYLLKQSLDPQKFISTFPTWVKDNGEPMQSRLGWCYGDLSTGLVLRNLSVDMNDKSLMNYADDVISKTLLRKSPDLSFVVDAGLCHGSSGIAYMYYKLFLKTNNPVFSEAALFWLDKTLEFSNHKDGLAGYKTFAFNEFSNQLGFLVGISGIGLSLLTFVSNYQPTWDSYLLIN